MKASINLDRRKLLVAAVTAGGAIATGLFTSSLVDASRLNNNMETPMTSLSQNSLYTTSLSATTLTGEAADRAAIRELIDAWAHFADRRLADKQADLFTPDGGYSVYDGDPATGKLLDRGRGHAEILAALAGLNKYTHTTHFNGQATIAVQGERGVGECYCLAHQLYEENGERKLQLLSIRYHDDYVRENGRWLFFERKLIIDWSDTRTSVA